MPQTNGFQPAVLASPPASCCDELYWPFQKLITPFHISGPLLKLFPGPGVSKCLPDNPLLTLLLSPWVYSQSQLLILSLESRPFAILPVDPLPACALFYSHIGLLSVPRTPSSFLPQSLSAHPSFCLECSCATIPMAGGFLPVCFSFTLQRDLLWLLHTEGPPSSFCSFFPSGCLSELAMASHTSLTIRSLPLLPTIMSAPWH